MSIGSRIKQRREEMNITQEELARLLNVSKGAIGNYESGLSYPKIENMNKLFEILKTDANFLFQDNIKLNHDSFSEKEKLHIKKYRTLDKHGEQAVDSILDIEYDRCTACEDAVDEPITISISRSLLPASAGSGEFLSDEYLEPREYPDCENARRADVVIPVSGDSMEPKFYDGDELYVRLQPAVEIGEIGIFIIEGKGYVKEYAEDRLISLNPEYDDVYPSEYGECRCVGKVIGKV